MSKWSIDKQLMFDVVTNGLRSMLKLDAISNEAYKRILDIMQTEAVCPKCGRQSNDIKSTLVSIKPVKRIMECSECYKKRCARDWVEANR